VFEAIETLLTGVPRGLLLQRMNGVLKCMPVDRSGLRDIRGTRMGFPRQVRVLPGTPVFSNLNEFRHHLRARLIETALDRSGTRHAATVILGPRLLRQIWERATNQNQVDQPRPELQESRRTEARVHQWARCIRRCPLPNLPRQLERFAAHGGWVGTVWYGEQGLVRVAHYEGKEVPRVHPLLPMLRDELEVDLSWMPLLKLACSRSTGSAGQPAMSADERDLEFMRTLRRRGSLEVPSGPYQGYQIELVRSHRARLTVELPEHLAETPAGVHVRWPQARAGVEIRLDLPTEIGRDGPPLPYRFRTWSDRLRNHPVVGQRGEDGGYSICISDSAEQLAYRMARFGNGAPEAIFLECLAHLRRGYLYGVGPSTNSGVHHPYHPEALSLRCPDSGYDLFTRQKAEEYAKRHGIEIVRWQD
jgi:hypothetical protein